MVARRAAPPPFPHPPPTPRLPFGRVRYKLTWAAATERLAEAVVMTVGERNKQKPVADGLLTVAHSAAGSGPSGDLVRLLAGGDSASWQVREKGRER